MPCTGNDCDPNAGAAQRLALERSQLECFTKLYSILRDDRKVTISDQQFGDLGIARGSPLNVDDLSPPRQSDDFVQFFSPCGWTFESLESESDSGWDDREWLDLTRWRVDNWLPLEVAIFRSDWFRARLFTLESVEGNIWEPPVRHDGRIRWSCDREYIKDAIGLELPRWEYYFDTVDAVKYPYRGTWAYFAVAAADKPHAVCFMLDSSIPSEDIAARSEVEAAVKMMEFQHQRACFTNHHTKPILVCTQFDNQVARLTQAHFDTKVGIVIIRQSRLLEMRGPETPPDAWLLLRWMASSPVGPTQYQPPTSPSKSFHDEGSSHPPHIEISG